MDVHGLPFSSHLFFSTASAPILSAHAPQIIASEGRAQMIQSRLLGVFPRSIRALFSLFNEFTRSSLYNNYFQESVMRITLVGSVQNNF
jgi:hypothetical protein